MNKLNLEKPTEVFVESYINKFLKSSDENFKHYSYQELAIKKLKEIFPDNKDILKILIKVGILNSFYSTNIFKPFAVAERICNLNIDSRLKNGDPLLVQDIAKNTISGKNKNFYSFATKYCSMHEPEEYPIYDSYIRWILIKYKKQFDFYKFNENDLKDYKKFKEVLEKFKEFFGLQKFTFKQIDEFLWTYAKKIKPNDFNKRKGMGEEND